MIANPDPALRAFLLADGNLAAMVGDRVHPIVLPQGERRPSIVYTQISGLGDHHMEGPSGLNRIRYQLDAWAADADQADAVAKLLEARLDGFSGLMGSVQVQGVFADALRDDYDATADLYRVSQDFMLWFEER